MTIQELVLGENSPYESEGNTAGTHDSGMKESNNQNFYTAKIR